MRFAVLTLCFYIIMLAVQPCGDMVLASGVSEPTSASLSISAYLEGTEEPQEDDCSPFCSCSCCQTVPAYQFLQEIAETKLIVVSDKEPSDYTTPAIRTFSNSIWQPPRSC